ncbi:MAG: hypothetical protein AAFR56_01195, partial [Chloroflexota bacterium]
LELPPSPMTDDDDFCPDLEDSASLLVRATSGFPITSVTAQLDIIGGPDPALAVRDGENGEYRIQLDIPDLGDEEEDYDARVEVIAQDSVGRTASINATFRIVYCEPPAPTRTPETELQLAWLGEPAAALTADNFYCPDIPVSVSGRFSVISNVDVDRVEGTILFDTAAEQMLELQMNVDTEYSFTISPELFTDAGAASGTITIEVEDSAGNIETLSATIQFIQCELEVLWLEKPEGSVTVDNSLCSFVPLTKSGRVSISVPSVIDEGSVFYTVSDASGGALTSSAVLTETSTPGEFSFTFDPASATISYVGDASITVTVLDMRGETYTLQAEIILSDCTLEFFWVTLPAESVAGSNATCPATPERVSGVIRSTLPEAIDTVSGIIALTTDGSVQSVTVGTLSAGRFSIEINGPDLPAINSSGIITFRATDILGAEYTLTAPVNLIDCRGALIWAVLPPTTITLDTGCRSTATLPFTVSFSAEVPTAIPPGTITAEGRNFDSGQFISYDPITDNGGGLYSFVIDGVPPMSLPGETFVVRAFAPEHRDITPFVSTTIVECTDDDD